MRLLVLVVFVVAVACGPTPPPPGPVRGCESVIRYAPSRSLDAVAIRGEWNQFAPEPLRRRDDGTFEFRATLEPRVSGYAYRFDLGNDELLRDPVNGFTRWVGGVEQSRLRTPDCRAPLLEVTSFATNGDGALQLEVRASMGSTRARLEAPRVLLDGREAAPTFDEAAGTLRLEASGLSRGKHTVKVTLSDEAGRAAEPLLLPFWTEAEPFAWEEATLYFVFTDRFRNGDPSNDRATPNVDPLANYQGGDFKGVTQAIEEGYFDRLGVRALWLSPPDANPDGAYDGSYGQRYTGYHGYWPSAPRAVQPRFGTLADLKALTKAAHARGLRVLTDLVLNHVHETHPYVAAHRDDGWFNIGNGCVCGAKGCGWDEKALVCSFTSYLPDYNWRSTAMADQFAEDMLWWLEEADLDGFRLDAVKHLDSTGGRTVNQHLARITAVTGTKYYLVGETFTGADGRPSIRQYIGPQELDGQFDFPLYWPVVQAFARGDSLVPVDDAVRLNESYYAPGTINSPFLGNHDVARFISIAANQIEGDANGQSWGPNRPPATVDADEPFERMRWAFTFILTQAGVPLIYYGDELGLPGAGDPDNRRFMKWTGLTPREQGLLDFMRKLGAARRSSRALRFGVRDTLLVERDLYVYQRSTADDGAVVVINRGPARTVAVPLARSLAQAPGPLRDAVTGAVWTPGASRTLSIPARAAMVFVRP
ncbi:MAG: glycosyl hydrolase [Myxococcaceae bacterium]|nr:glycosyl hydrolase [Myxococcaceae bacterium]MCA3013418.1 glycosyl hydrolase [Myxococcaceae bacterium]